MAQMENPDALAGATGAGVPCYAVAVGILTIALGGFCGNFAASIRLASFVVLLVVCAPASGGQS
jgi:hypothetical protein